MGVPCVSSPSVSIANRCFSHSRSTSTRYPSMSSFTLLRGAGRPSSMRRGRSRASRRLRNRGRPSTVLRQGARIARRRGAPSRRPLTSIRSTSSTSRTRRIAACSTKRRMELHPVLPAMSTRVREAFVHRIRSRTSTSSASGRRTRCQRMPWILRPDQSGGITSNTGSCLSHNPSSSAALPWDNTAPSPQASAAAIRCPLRVIAR